MFLPHIPLAIAGDFIEIRNLILNIGLRMAVSADSPQFVISAHFYNHLAGRKLGAAARRPL